MFRDNLPIPVIKLFNRVLSDYPAARAQLQPHQGKVIAAQVGPATARMRVTAQGEMELVGTAATPPLPPDVSFMLPLSLLPGLASKDETALSQIVFSGDSELAATLADVARHVKWDVEEDLSRMIGDVAAHRVFNTVQRARAWRTDATQRLGANVAEYLTEERRAFITARELEELASRNEMLRDDIARIEARLSKLAAGR